MKGSGREERGGERKGKRREERGRGRGKGVVKDASRKPKFSKQQVFTVFN